MAVRQPKKPQRLPKGGGRSAASADIYDPPAQRRAKSIYQTQTNRNRGAGVEDDEFRATPEALRAVRPRGSKFGRYTIESGDEGDNESFSFPQIDPTNTTNPGKPRTLQAGYYRERGAETGTLRVRFRDGTPWEYYDVPPNVWRNFKRVKSPGKFINRVLNNFDYGRGNF